jgi:hypothetical protein
MGGIALKWLFSTNGNREPELVSARRREIEYYIMKTDRYVPSSGFDISIGHFAVIDIVGVILIWTISWRNPSPSSRIMRYHIHLTAIQASEVNIVAEEI